MGGMLSQPVTKKRSDQGEGLGLRYGLSSMQGWRPEMEDAHDVQVGLKFGLDDWSYFAVFDGHAGKCAAAFAACNLLDYILRDSTFQLKTGHWSGPVHIGPNGEILKESEEAGDKDSSPQEQQDAADEGEQPAESDNQKIESGDETSISEPSELSDNTPKEKSPTAKSDDGQEKSDINDSSPHFNSMSPLEQLDMVKQAVRAGFLEIDYSMRMSAQDMSGCTAVCTFISPTHIFFANCGDSRAVLYNGVYPKFATEDHKPFNPRERKRIIAAGGTATQRINGTLAVSRALGDFEFKKDRTRGPCAQLVSPEPDITIIKRQPDDEFLILACDGIWDVMSNDDLCEFVRHRLTVEPSLENICSSVIDVCLRKGSRDNMSIIIVVFKTGSRISESVIEQEKKNDELLLKFVDSLQDEQSTLTFPGFFSVLKDELDELNQVKNQAVLLPPGAGIEAKFDLIRERWEERSYALNNRVYDQKKDDSP